MHKVLAQVYRERFVEDKYALEDKVVPDVDAYIPLLEDHYSETHY